MQRAVRAPGAAPLPSRGPQWRILRDASRSSNGLLDGEQFAVAIDVPDDKDDRVDAGTVADERPRTGFEVQITGPSSARRIVFELVIVSTSGGRLPARSTLRIAVNTRDL